LHFRIKLIINSIHTVHIITNILIFSASQKLCAPAAEQNKQLILEVLQQYLPEMVARKTPLQCLEVASGSGQHVAHFAEHLPGTHWQPAEFDRNDFGSIKAYAQELPNVSEPVFVDASLQGRTFDVVYCANMIHISPRACTPGLFNGAGAFLEKGGLLITYGPYARRKNLSREQPAL
jgi:hypothetical protein